jgi:hypothetical protein
LFLVGFSFPGFLLLAVTCCVFGLALLVIVAAIVVTWCPCFYCSCGCGCPFRMLSVWHHVATATETFDFAIEPHQRPSARGCCGHGFAFPRDSRSCSKYSIPSYFFVGWVEVETCRNKLKPSTSSVVMHECMILINFAHVAMCLVWLQLLSLNAADPRVYIKRHVRTSPFAIMDLTPAVCQCVK